MVMDTETFLSINHGSRSGYEQGCRCDNCVQAMRANWRNSNDTYRHKKYRGSMRRHDDKIDALLEILYG